MIIKVGTGNQIKVEAVKEVIKDYPGLADANVGGLNIDSGVAEQPIGMDKTVCGAFNRAAGACKEADLGIGIESGLMLTPLGWLNFTAAVVCENNQAFQLNYLTGEKGIHFGHSTGFPLPSKVVDCILNKGMDLDQAAYECGFVDVPNIGKVPGGFLGVLTKGRISRQEYSKQALTMALISWENKEMFGAE